MLNPRQSFQSFVVGAGNRLAVAAARAVAEAPAAAYNPLFVYARPGLGKTHLLMAIGNAAAGGAGRLRVAYQTLDQFVEAFQQAIAQGKADAYRQHYLEHDLILVDDLQFLAGRREAQAELLRLIDTLQAAGRQIVLASDRPPAEIQSLDERLVTRFAGGLVIDMSAPDYETRVAILRRRAQDRSASFAPGVLEAVAELPLDNVRELLGALNRLVAWQAVSEGPLDAARARELAAGPALSTAQVASSPAPADEFGDFLTDVASTLTRQVDAWRESIAQAVFRWEAEGYRTTRLETLLGEELTEDPDVVLRGFAADIATLKRLEEEAVALAPELAGDPAFRDPDHLPAAEAALARAREEAGPPPSPLAQWRLDAFVEVPGNRMAVRAAHAVIAQPGAAYNPFVIVGGDGAGKTHLLHALGNALAAAGTGVACLGAEEFTADLIDALGHERLGRWRSRYRRAGAFLLDDIDRLQGKEATQDELYLLFNQMLERGRQLVFTSTLPPGGLTGLEPRLRSRLEAGLVVELPTPDRALRLDVIERLLADRTGHVEPDLLAYLAGQPAGSLHEAVALVERLLAAAGRQGRPLTAALARDLIEGPPATHRRVPAPRASGLTPATSAVLRTAEKTVLEWPHLGDLLLEEWD